MFKHVVFTSALLIGLAGAGAYGQTSPLRAEIKLSRTSVKNNELLSVSTIIRNTSREDQSFVAWACGYGRQWTSDSLSAQVNHGEPCLANALVKVKLKPGNSYQKKIQVSVTLPAAGAPQEAVTFRLGFASERDQPAPAPASGAATTPRLWSNAVTVTVTR